MSKYMVVFMLDGIRKFEPALEIGNKQITYLTDISDDAKANLKVEIGEDLFNKLWGKGISCVQIDVVADDDKSAIKKAWVMAEQVTNALSLLEFDEQAISISFKDSPRLIPNVLLANMEEEPVSLKFGHYTPPGLMRVNLGALEQKAKDFNEKVVRHIERIMPSVIWDTSELENELLKRVAHSLHWYAIAMNQQENEFRFVAMWFALESLIIESIKTQGKKRVVVNRLPKLYFIHNSVEINDKHVESLWELRSNIVHEARSGFMRDRPLISAGHINLARYFYFLTILFILDTLRNAISISQAWQIFPDYTPSITIKHETMPGFINFGDMFRSRQ